MQNRRIPYHVVKPQTEIISKSSHSRDKWSEMWASLQIFDKLVFRKRAGRRAKRENVWAGVGGGGEGENSVCTGYLRQLTF